MQKIFVVGFLLTLPLNYAFNNIEKTENNEKPKVTETPKTEEPKGTTLKTDTVQISPPEIQAKSAIQQLYEEINLENIVNYTVFEQALIGYNKLDAKNKDIITLIDFSKPSTEKRFYVIDMKNKKLLFSSHVAHGKNSGEKYATSFSNLSESNKSSLGFYVTQETYQGKNGYSLRLNGLEKGFNHNARARAIVIHSSAYSNPEFAQSAGRLGRSLGCPALPEALNKPIINTIKNGTLLFIYADNSNYLNNSTVLH